MKKIILLFTLTFLFINCQGQTSKTITQNTANEGIKTIAEIDFETKLLQQKNPQLIDVRTPDEYNVEHLISAVNINWDGDDFITKASSYDKEKPVFVYCKVGGRSAQAANKLTELGFKEIYNLDGGIMKWKGKKTQNLSKTPIGLSTNEFEKIKNSNKKVMINFYAKWCEPCKKMQPYILKMQDEMQDQLKIVRLDADQNKSLLDALKLDGLPVIIVYENGKEMWRNIGYTSEEDLKKHL